jgi:hypothetical protein
MGEPFSTASTHTSVRQAIPLVMDPGPKLLLPLPRLVLSAAPKRGSCGGMNRDQRSLNVAVAMDRVIDY